MHPLLQRTWDTADVVVAMREALEIVEQLEPPEDMRHQTFVFVTQLVTQVAQRTSVGAIQLPQPPVG